MHNFLSIQFHKTSLKYLKDEEEARDKSILFQRERVKREEGKIKEFNLTRKLTKGQVIAGSMAFV